MDTFVIVFVCTGNMCRSPMAEGIMKELILDEVDSKTENLPIKVMSAGTHASEGSHATENAVMIAGQHGIDIHLHESRLVTVEIVNNADLILTMEKMHTDIIRQNWPHITSVYELENFGRKKYREGITAEVTDPIGMGSDAYLDVFRELKHELERVSPIIFSMAREKCG